MRFIFNFSLFIFSFSLALAQEYRFPKPEFSTGHQLPQPTTPMPTAWSGNLWSILLILFLTLSVLAVYRWRSRKVQLVIIFVSLLLFGFYRNGCICSVGSVQNVVAACFDSSFPLSMTTVLFFGVPILLALFFGRVFCGAACPLGAIQELLHFRSLKVPYVLDRALRILPLFYLGGAVVLAASQTSFIICEYDPFVGFFRFAGSAPMITFGVVLLLTGLFVSRPYCRYFCPYGVLLRYAGLLSSKKVRITSGDCINCRLCENACPHGAILPPEDEKGKEPRRVAIKRMKWLLSMTPGVMAIGFITGAKLGPILARLHPDVKLLDAIEKFSKGIIAASDNVTAFLASGTPIEILSENVTRVMNFTTNFSAIVGAVLGLIIVIELILLSRRNENKEYSVNMGDCYCCSRCYSYCPVKE